MMTRIGKCSAPAEDKKYEELMVSMKNHRIPDPWTDRVAKALGIKKIADIASMQLATVRLAPKQFWQQIMDLRNFHLGSRATVWYVPEDW